jgi:tellurite resistance protein TerC
MSSTALLWLIFWSVFIGVSATDYFLHSKHQIDVKSALRWTGLWMAVGLGFSAVIYFLHPSGPRVFTEYISGWLTEYSLSVDNLFVFILIFSLMGVPEIAQPKLIKLGIYLSIVLRILFILFGIALIERFHALIYIFGLLLIWTAWKMIATDEDDQVHPDHNLFYKLGAKLLPVHKEDPSTRKLFTRFEGKLFVTPLFLVFLVIGSTDVLFAVDSIPAIMGISQDPFVVLTSNVFAVLGLNSLFFAIRGIMGMFKFLKHGVSIILFFIGAKMVVPGLGVLLSLAGLKTVGEKLKYTEVWFKEVPYVPLLVIVCVLGVSIALSMWHDRMVKGTDNKRPDYEV